jgi:hypothetical protein
VSLGRGARCHSTEVFLNHSQMDSESLQIGFERAWNSEHPSRGFNLDDSRLILYQSGLLAILGELVFELA